MRFVHTIGFLATLCMPIAADADGVLGSYGSWNLWRGNAPGDEHTPLCYLAANVIPVDVNSLNWSVPRQGFLILDDKKHELAILYFLPINTTNLAPADVSFAFSNGDIIDIKMQRYSNGFAYTLSRQGFENRFLASLRQF